MTLDDLQQRLPDWARDTRLNLNMFGSAAELSPRLAWGTALAAAVASRRRALIDAIAAAAAGHLDDAGARAARAAAAIMAMNNVYYRFLHFTAPSGGGESEYARRPARLRMQVIGNPGVAKLDFELWCLAVSAINGCEACVRAHDAAVRAAGGTVGMIHDAVRIAAVIHAAAVALDGALDSRYPIPTEAPHVPDAQPAA